MATSRHIIHQQAIEINAMNKNTAQPLFLEISRLFNNRAKDVAGYIFDKYDRESELIKIDVLDVDIGAIPFPFSEESFVKVYSEKFEEALSGMIKKQLQLAESRPQQSDSAIAKRSILHLLEQFLLTGTIAWWAGKEELKDPVRVFNALQEKEMPLLKATIMRLFPEAMVRKRLVYAFTEEHIKTVISMVQPAEQEYIVRYHARVSYLQTEHHFVRTDSTGFGKALWLFILDFLADHSGNRFNRKMFVRSTLAAIATRFNVRFEELLFFFSEALKEIPEKLRKMENLLSLLEEITLEELHPFYTKAFGQSGSDNGMMNTPLSKTAQALFFFLLNGFFPIGFQATDGTTLNSDLINTIR
ncbi:MAG: contractile injection system tape measure protein, partial [Bacteroidia bacterium]|nr:contractile injection system tape measure protein [Bacteroidia bacterium]